MNKSDHIFIPITENPEIVTTRQNLPHWDQDNATYFVTFRLYDSIPVKKQKQWKDEIELWRKVHHLPWDDETWLEYYSFIEKKQKWLDSGFGSCILTNSWARDSLVTVLRHFDCERYILDEFVVMPNHVHIIVKPVNEHRLTNILHSWKSYSAKQINQILTRNGKVWMDESFDRIIRSWHQLQHYRNYVKDNPKYLNNGHYSLGKGCSALTVS